MAPAEVLVVSEPFDIHADWVMVHLADRRARVLRLHPEDFAQIERYEVRVGTDSCFLIETASGTWESDRLSAVYHRRPNPPLAPEHLNQPEASFWAAEAQELVDGLLALVPSSACWVNHPTALRTARNKIVQLHRAASLGLRPPRTLVTNDPAAAMDFFESTGRKMICKAMSYARVGDDARQAYVYTHRVPESAGADYFETIRYGSSLLQEEISPRSYDVRATLVGATVFACAIRAPDTEVDWRTADPNDTTIEPIELPERVSEMLVSLQTSQGLIASQADLIVDDRGNHYFLEMNPNGQWLFVERATNQPIGAAMADLLLSKVTPR